MHNQSACIHYNDDGGGGGGVLVEEPPYIEEAIPGDPLCDGEIMKDWIRIPI